MSRSIHTVLVANRGEIARRVFRTCRKMGIRSVAVYSDADAQAPHVGDADRAVRIGPPEPSASYLDIEAILDAAKATGADAIHPGYGFLSENAEFAEACAKADVIFLGPPAAAIRTMGSKLESKRLMESAGVPVLASIEITGGTDLEAEAAGIGFPVLVKASAGGGGKGMRVVETAAGLAAAVEGASREAASAFGDGTVFLERYLTRPRHVEVQVFGDQHGTVISLFERECSIQRRHQKVIEEAPSPAVDEALREKLGAAAVEAAKAVGYVGAGTVEFLLDEDGTFSFLEMNTRLQVEHPVTEMVTGMDLVRLQIEVAEGFAIPDSIHHLEPFGHAIEARLYAEDPANEYLPAIGTVHRFTMPDTVRVDSGVESGSQVQVHYDPLLAKVIAHGPDRASARRTLATALRSAQIHGVTTNRELLVRVLEDEEFAAGSTDTGFLERRDPVALSASLAHPREVEMMLLAASIAGERARRASATVLASLPSGYRNNPSQLTIDTYRVGNRDVRLGYRITGDSVRVEIDGEARDEVTIMAADAGRVRLRSGGVDETFEVHHVADRIWVDTALASVAMQKLRRLPVPERAVEPGSLLSPMPGKVVRVLTELGAEVASGVALVVVEAMKMEHTVAAPHNGVVASLPVAEGDQVEADQILAVVEPR